MKTCDPPHNLLYLEPLVKRINFWQGNSANNTATIHSLKLFGRCAKNHELRQTMDVCLLTKPISVCKTSIRLLGHGQRFQISTFSSPCGSHASWHGEHGGPSVGNAGNGIATAGAAAGAAAGTAAKGCSRSL